MLVEMNTKVLNDCADLRSCPHSSIHYTTLTAPCTNSAVSSLPQVLDLNFRSPAYLIFGRLPTTPEVIDAFEKDFCETSIRARDQEQYEPSSLVVSRGIPTITAWSICHPTQIIVHLHRIVERFDVVRLVHLLFDGVD